MTRRVPARLAASAVLACTIAALAAVPVLAHASVPDGSAVPADGSAVIHVRLPHGCDGAAITAVSVQLPDGVVGAKPQLIAGWTASTEKVPATYTLYGTDYTERVGTITWTGGPLPDGQFLDFGISATFQLEAGEYPLPVVQTCGNTSVAWIEVPAAGQTHDDLEHPAPTFTVVEATAEAGHDHGGATESMAPMDGHTDGAADGDTGAVTAELAAVKAQVAALQQATVTPAPAEPSAAPLALGIAVVALLAGLAGLGMGLAAARRRS